MCPALNATAGVIPLPDGRLPTTISNGRLTIGREAQLATDRFALCGGKRSGEDIIVSLRDMGTRMRGGAWLTTIPPQA
jgi:hypothetical protein